MAGRSRYSLGDKEAGIQDGVLENKLGIRHQSELDDAETILFSDAYKHFFDLHAQGKLTLDLSLLFHIHEYFLSPLYAWAGKIRSVEIAKGGTRFASASHIADSLHVFEKTFRQKIPTHKKTKQQIAQCLAVIHCELNAIHPFREGNGRTIRLFLDLLAAQAGFNPIEWDKRTQKAYIQACADGMLQEYSAMAKIIYAGLKKQNGSLQGA